jgi:hypothetical protein
MKKTNNLVGIWRARIKCFVWGHLFDSDFFCWRCGGSAPTVENATKALRIRNILMNMALENPPKKLQGRAKRLKK